MEIGLFILILLVLIVGHELGHFSIAKWVGMKVTEFGVGFPPRLLGIQRGETVYSVNLIPFGGFVKIHGEDQEDRFTDRSFVRFSKSSQAAVLAAGPAANIAIGFCALFAAFMIGIPTVVDGTAHDGAEVVVASVLVDSPAAVAGILPGDRVLQLGRNDVLEAVRGSGDISAHIGESTEPITIVVARDSEQFSFVLLPVAGLLPDDPSRAGIGISTVVVSTDGMPFFAALQRAAAETARSLVAIVVGIGTLIVGAVTWSGSLSDITGPVGIAGLVGEASAFGVGQVLALAAIISLNLAVINLLPFPALDGGRLALLFLEIVRGRSVKDSTVQLINGAGFAALILLMVVITWNDILRLVA